MSSLIDSSLRVKKDTGHFQLNNRGFSIQKNCRYFADGDGWNSCYTMAFTGDIHWFKGGTYPYNWFVHAKDNIDNYVPRRVTPRGLDDPSKFFKSIVSPYDMILYREDPESEPWHRGYHEIAFEMLQNYPAYNYRYSFTNRKTSTVNSTFFLYCYIRNYCKDSSYVNGVLTFDLYSDGTYETKLGSVFAVPLPSPTFYCADGAVFGLPHENNCIPMIGADLGNQDLPVEGSTGIFAFEWKNINVPANATRDYVVVVGVAADKATAQSRGEVLKLEYKKEALERKNYILNAVENISSGSFDFTQSVKFSAGYIISLIKDSPELPSVYQPCLLNVQGYEFHGGRYLYDSLLIAQALIYIKPELARNVLKWCDYIISLRSDPSAGADGLNAIWYPIIVWEYYEYTGDLAGLSDFYTQAKRTLDAFLSRPTTINGHTLYRTLSRDWKDTGYYWGVHTHHSSLIYKALLDFAKTCYALGYTSVGDSYLSLASPLKTAINAVLWIGDRYVEGISDSGEIKFEVVPGSCLTILYGIADATKAKRFMSTLNEELFNSEFNALLSSPIPPGSGYYQDGGIWWHTTQWYVQVLSALNLKTSVSQVCSKLGNLHWYNAYWTKTSLGAEHYRAELPEYIAMPPYAAYACPASLIGGLFFPWSYSSIVNFLFLGEKKLKFPRQEKFRALLLKSGTNCEIYELVVEENENKYVFVRTEKCIVSTPKESERLLQAGRISVGDVFAYFSSESSVKEGYRVKIGEALYHAASVVPVVSNDENVCLKALLKVVDE